MRRRDVLFVLAAVSTTLSTAVLRADQTPYGLCPLLLADGPGEMRADRAAASAVAGVAGPQGPAAFLARELAGNRELATVLDAPAGPSAAEVSRLVAPVLARFAVDGQPLPARTHEALLELVTEAVLRHGDPARLTPARLVGIAAERSAADDLHLQAAAGTLPPAIADTWHVFVREPFDGRPSPVYLANQWNALRLFTQWLREPDGVSYRAMMQAMHRTALAHRGYDRGGGGISDPTHTQPGQLRRPGARAPLLTVDPVVVVRLMRAGVTVAGRAEGPTAIEGIPAEACPQIRVARGIRVQYPTPEQLPLYVARLETLMGDIAAMTPERTRADPAEMTRFLGLVARYHQVGAAAHLFDGVNNSLLMAQVNVLLERHGLRAMPHAFHDYVALLEPTPAYARYFIGQVRAAGNESRLAP